MPQKARVLATREGIVSTNFAGPRISVVECDLDFGEISEGKTRVEGQTLSPICIDIEFLLVRVNAI